MSTVVAVAVEYEEPEYEATRRCLSSAGLPVVLWADRQGVGSLVSAYNCGYRAALEYDPDFVWFVSNVTFAPELPGRLLEQLQARPKMAAIHPAFSSSNHPHCKPNGTDQVIEGAFIEFTCPLVRSDVFARFPLDEAMPYWGHDLDWGYRVREAGWTIGVDHGAPEPGHEYIWAINEHPVTVRRKRLRAATNAPTKMALVDKYGPDWMTKLKYFGPPVSP